MFVRLIIVHYSAITLALEITYHSLDEVQVLGHHVVEVVCDENSSDK